MSDEDRILRADDDPAVRAELDHVKNKAQKPAVAGEKWMQQHMAVAERRILTESESDRLAAEAASGGLCRSARTLRASHGLLRSRLANGRSFYLPRMTATGVQRCALLMYTIAWGVTSQPRPSTFRSCCQAVLSGTSRGTDAC